MAAREWLIPMALGLLVFSVLLWLPSPAGDEEVQARGLLPFEQVRVGDAHGHADVLVLAREPQPVQDPWLTPHVGVLRSSSTITVCLSFAPCSVLHEVAAPAEPRLGQAGFNGTRLTIHVFDAEGELVASNGNASEQARLTRTYAPEQLPHGTWYLGDNATAPPGTQEPPLAARAFLPQVRHLLEGLPVGGVATTQTDALATWYGTLYVTAQVEELVHAP